MVVPPANAVTTPVLPIVATAGALLLQAPPPTGSINVDDPPAQTVVTPVINPASLALTVILFVADAIPQPVVTVYEITAEPTEMTVKSPQKQPTTKKNLI